MWLGVALITPDGWYASLGFAVAWVAQEATFPAKYCTIKYGNWKVMGPLVHGTRCVTRAKQIHEPMRPMESKAHGGHAIM